VQIKETEKVDSTAELRQGDILRIENVDAAHQAPNLGVIINADCDLAWGRTDGVIAYLPIYSFRSYLELFWMPIHLSDVLKSSTENVNRICNFDEKYGNDIHAWLETAQQEEVFEKLVNSTEIKTREQDNLKRSLSKLQICINKKNNALAAFSALCKLENDPKSYAGKQIRAAKKARGDGHLFISDLFGQEEIGFVIRMLRIYTLDANCCFTSLAAQKSSSNGTRSTAVRIARLTDLYQFKIAQMFAYQYSRIGLSDEIMALEEIAIDDMATQIIEVSK
jgi:hypothetical protein